MGGTTRFTDIENGQLGTCTCLHKRSCTSFYAIIMSTTLVRPGLIMLTKHGSHAYASLYTFPSTPIQASLFVVCFTNLYKQRNIYKGLSTFVSFHVGLTTYNPNLHMRETWRKDNEEQIFSYDLSLSKSNIIQIVLYVFVLITNHSSRYNSCPWNSMYNIMEINNLGTYSFINFKFSAFQLINKHFIRWLQKSNRSFKISHPIYLWLAYELFFFTQSILEPCSL